MWFNHSPPILAQVTAATATTAAFAKTFLPFYLIGSTVIFAATSAIALVLALIGWRQLYTAARRMPEVLILVAALYGLVIANFLFLSRHDVPVTHLIGILIFHFLFLMFGLAAARSLKATLLVLCVGAAIYVMVIVQHTVRFGDIMRNNYFNDIFGVGIPSLFVTFHQNVGLILGYGVLAALALASGRHLRTFAIVGVLALLAFLFHISARGALVALMTSFAFLAFAALWVRSRKAALFGAISLLLAAIVLSGVFYQRALKDNQVDPVAPDTISRTIREIQDPRPGFRLQIWARTWHQIASEPEQLVFGRGIGMFPVKEGFGAPDWLLRKTEGARHYPHNTHLEMLYEAGIVGLLLFSILTLFPMIAALRLWHLLSWTEKLVIAIYVFNFAGTWLSGAFAFSYDFQFFFALAAGVIAGKRENGTAFGLRVRSGNSTPVAPATAEGIAAPQ